jgi:mannosyltransferase OCH1-like enzyme
MPSSADCETSQRRVSSTANIPRIIHQIWLGPDPLPSDHRPWIASWKRHHPDWEHRFWTEEDLPADPIRPEVLERLRAPVERADILRLEILYRHGGVYADTDLECLRAIDPLLDGERFVGVSIKPGRMTNTLIASAPGHPLLDRALRELQPMQVYWTTWAPRSIKESAGPPLLRRLVGDYPDVKVLEPPVFFPATPEERAQASGVHHMARVWHNATQLRAAMLQAERRLEVAKAELEKERRRHAATQRQMAKLARRLEEARRARPRLRDRLGLPRRSR